jgi:hypothetical protein
MSGIGAVRLAIVSEGNFILSKTPGASWAGLIINHDIALLQNICQGCL